jgi:hypothetical protein
VAAVFAVFVSVAFKRFAAIRACQIIKRLSIHPFMMGVPPSVSAIVVAEGLCPSFARLFKPFSALFAKTAPSAARRIGESGVKAYIFAAAKGLDGVYGKLKRSCYLRITQTLPPHFPYALFLLARHTNSPPMKRQGRRVTRRPCPKLSCAVGFWTSRPPRRRL